MAKKNERGSFHSAFLYDRANWGNFSQDVDGFLQESSPDENNRVEHNLKIIILVQKSASKNILKSKENKGRINNFTPEIRDVLNKRNFWAKKFRLTRDELSAKIYG